MKNTTLTAAAPHQVNNPADKMAVEMAEICLGTAQDVDGVMRFYAPEALLVDYMAMRPYRGTKEIKADLAPQYAELTAFKPQFSPLVVVTDGELACDFGMQDFEVYRKDGGRAEAGSFRATNVLRKTNGQWQSIHQHISYAIENVQTRLGLTTQPSPPAASLQWNVDTLQGPPVPEAQATAEIRKWAEGLFAADTPEQRLQFFGPGDGFRIFDAFNPGVYQGKAETLRGWTSTLDAKPKNIKLKELFVYTDGLFGAVYSDAIADVTGPDGATRPIPFRSTNCLHRVDGNWFSYHEHNSFPIAVNTASPIDSKKPAGAVQ